MQGLESGKRERGGEGLKRRSERVFVCVDRGRKGREVRGRGKRQGSYVRRKEG